MAAKVKSTHSGHRGSIPPASSHLTAAGSATLGVRTPGRILLGPLGRVKPKMLPSASFQTGREPALSAFAGDALLGRRGKRRLLQILFGKLATGGAHAPLVLGLVGYGRHA